MFHIAKFIIRELVADIFMRNHATPEIYTCPPLGCLTHECAWEKKKTWNELKEKKKGSRFSVESDRCLVVKQHMISRYFVLVYIFFNDVIQEVTLRFNIRVIWAEKCVTVENYGEKIERTICWEVLRPTVSLTVLKWDDSCLAYWTGKNEQKKNYVYPLRESNFNPCASNSILRSLDLLMLPFRYLRSYKYDISATTNRWL